MFTEIFDYREPPVAARHWRPNSNETSRLHRIAQRDRTVAELVCELTIFKNFLDECKASFDPLALTGLMHQVDETYLRLSLAPAMTEADIDLKMGFLQGFEPCIISNLNLPVIAQAAIAADIARLQSTATKFLRSQN